MNSKRISILTLGLVCAVALGACGSNNNNSNSPSGSATTSGSVGGKAFAPKSTIFNVATLQGSRSTVAEPNAATINPNDVGASPGVDPNILGDANATLSPNVATVNPNAAIDANSAAASIVSVVLTTADSACSLAQANETPSNSSFLYFLLVGVTQPGTYQITGDTDASVRVNVSALPVSKVALPKVRAAATPTSGGSTIVGGGFMTTDASCNDGTAPALIASGTLTITTFNTQQTIAGSYDITLATGDKLSGQFSASDCITPANGVSQDPNSTCK